MAEARSEAVAARDTPYRTAVEAGKAPLRDVAPGRR